MYIETINFERTGGFAGIRLAAEIELDDLPDDQKHEILELLDEMDFDELSEKRSGKMSVPDEFVYSVIVKSKEKEYRLLTSESSIPEDMRPLIELLEGIAKKQMRKNR